MSASRSRQRKGASQVFLRGSLGRESAELTSTGERVWSEYRIAGGVILVIRVRDAEDKIQSENVDSIRKFVEQQRGPFAVILDMRGLEAFPATQRTMYAEFRRSVSLIYASFHCLTVYLTDEEKQRGFLTAVGWQAATSGRGRKFSLDLEEAWNWCEQALRANSQ